MKPDILCIKRSIYTDRSTIGDVYFENKRQCYSLEDTVRHGPKVYGKTAIPSGIYKIGISYSGRYGKPMPYILNVDNFTHVMIHPGNTPEHTDGCILVGETMLKDFIGYSRVAFDKLYPKIVNSVISNGLLMELI